MNQQTFGNTRIRQRTKKLHGHGGKKMPPDKGIAIIYGFGERIETDIGNLLSFVKKLDPNVHLPRGFSRSRVEIEQGLVLLRQGDNIKLNAGRAARHASDRALQYLVRFIGRESPLAEKIVALKVKRSASYYALFA